MEKESEKPPDVYPTDPDEMAVRVQDILDRHRKAEKQLVFAYCRQQDRLGRALDLLDGLPQKIGAWMRKVVAIDRRATRQ
jgi:hypothetical protein